MPRIVGFRSRCASRRGSATVAVTIAALVIVGTAGAVVAVCRRDAAEPCSERGLKARAIAEAALSAKISQMVAGNYADLGSNARGVPFAGGSAWVGVENFDVRRELFRLTAQGTFADETQVVEAVLRPVVDPAPACAVFAGNSSDDPRYVLAFGGEGEAADAIEGDVYSGRSIFVLGDARIEGRLRARRSVEGAEGDYPVARRGPDFGAVLRGRRATERMRTLHVDALFEDASREEDPWGGVACQVPPENPAHVFRRNPSDRAELTEATPGDDYFLEAPCGGDPGAAPGADGSAWVGVPGLRAGDHGATFVVDGNLWVSNGALRAVRFGRPEGEPASLAIVVRGNIHLGASILDPEGRGNAIALVALRHPGREASGDILIGGPGSNPVEEIDAFLFAERDIRRGAEDGIPAPLVVRGALVAGNHIDLGSGEAHVRLTVRGDARFANGELALAGVPASADRVAAFSVLSWRTLGAP